MALHSFFLVDLVWSANSQYLCTKVSCCKVQFPVKGYSLFSGNYTLQHKLSAQQWNSKGLFLALPTYSNKNILLVAFRPFKARTFLQEFFSVSPQNHIRGVFLAVGCQIACLFTMLLEEIFHHWSFREIK